MDQFKSSIKITTAVCNGVLRAALGNQGYEVADNGGFIEAFSGEKALAMLLVSRCLSDRNSTETTPIAASVPGVRKLLERYGVQNPYAVLEQRDEAALDVIVGNANVPGTLCLAFGVCKYSYRDIEVAVVPLKTFFRQAKTGSVLSIGSKSGDFFFDFAKATDDNTQDILLRTRFIERAFE